MRAAPSAPAVVGSACHETAGYAAVRPPDLV